MSHVWVRFSIYLISHYCKNKKPIYGREWNTWIGGALWSVRQMTPLFYFVANLWRVSLSLSLFFSLLVSLSLTYQAFDIPKKKNLEAMVTPIRDSNEEVQRPLLQDDALPPQPQPQPDPHVLRKLFDRMALVAQVGLALFAITLYSTIFSTDWSLFSWHPTLMGIFLLAVNEGNLCVKK